MTIKSQAELVKMHRACTIVVETLGKLAEAAVPGVTTKELDTIAREAAALREALESLKAQEALALVAEEHLRGVAAMLSQLRDSIAAIEASNDVAAKAEIVRLLVREIIVETTGEGRRKTATVRVRHAFSPPQAVEMLTV